jgi:hypothetical protein
LPASQAAALADINSALADLQTAYRTGNFATIGAAEAKVQQLVGAYVSKYPPPTSTPSPTPSPSKTK